MTYQLLSAVAAVGTFLVIGATAIAAILQLRHLRAGNQPTPLRKERLLRSFQTLLQENDLGKMRFHDLRGTHGTHLYLKKSPVAVDSKAPGTFGYHDAAQALHTTDRPNGERDTRRAGANHGINAAALKNTKKGRPMGI